MEEKTKKPRRKHVFGPRVRLAIKYSIMYVTIFNAGMVFALFIIAILANGSIESGDIENQIYSTLFQFVLIILMLLLTIALFQVLVYQLAFNDTNDDAIQVVKREDATPSGVNLFDADGLNNISFTIKDSSKKGDKDKKVLTESRFPTLASIDRAHPTLERVKCDPNLTLESICYNFRNYAANDLRLYYSEQDIRAFIASFSCSRIMLLQGMSGTGKTSLPVAFGKFIGHTTNVVPVQPTWKERSDLLGYYNEFTGRFSETPLLSAMYNAGTSDSIQLIILDEVNIARVEYYFAEFLSLLELPDQNSRVLQVASSGMANDPERMANGALLLPENVWFIGTANNDDSTFAISDKVYDRAAVLDLDKRAAPFRVEGQYTTLNISLQRLNRLNAEAQRRYALTDRDLRKINELDKFLRESFQISFGNRIMRQIRMFVPTYVACGGTSNEALDYILSKKVLRKLASCNPVLVKARSSELKDLIITLFGENGAPNCIEAVSKVAENA